MKTKLRILTSIIVVFFTMSILPVAAIDEVSGGSLAVRISEEKLADSIFEVKGFVEGAGESVSLVLNITKNGEQFLNKSFVTEENGTFNIEVEIDAAPEMVNDVYQYEISEAEPTSTLSVIKEDDFSVNGSYTAKSTIDDTVGNPAPSMKISNDEERLLFTGSSKLITNDNSIYSVSADVRVDSVASINKQVLGVSNSNGNGSGTNSEINKLGNEGFNAVKIMANNGRFIAEYGNNALNQTEITKKEIGSYSAQSWTNLKVEFSPETLILKIYVNGERVLEDENIYVLAQNSYTRLYDTWKTSGLMYIDNLYITKTAFSKFFGVESVSSEFVNYSQKTKSDLVDAVNSADENSVLDILKNEENEKVIGIDTSNLSDLTPEETDAVKEYIKSIVYTDITDIKNAYNYISVYLDIVTASDKETLFLKLSQNADLLGVPYDNLYYKDSDITDAIYTHIGDVTSPEELVEMTIAYATIYELRNIDYEVLMDNYDYLKNYGIRGDYGVLSKDGTDAVFVAMKDYPFDFSISYNEILSGWVEKINSEYDKVIYDSFDYILKNESCEVVDFSVFLKGSVAPAVSYKFRASAYVNDSEVAFSEFTTLEDGTYECEIKIPDKTDDVNYDIHITPVEPEAEYSYYFYDTFTSGERIGNYIVNKELYETPYNGVPAPSMCIAKEDGEERPRLLAGSGAVRDKVDGEILYIEADIMKAQNIASPKLWSITDYNGNKEAMTVKATTTDIVLYYKDADEGFVTKTLIKDFGKIKWYNIKFAVVMTEGEKSVEVYVNNNKTLSFNLSADIPNIGRFFDSEALTVNSDIHYIDNIKCYVDKAFRINASDDYVSTMVYGEDKIKKAINELINSGENGYVEVMDRYSDILGIDTSFVKSLKDTSNVDLNIMSGVYLTIADVRELYYAECHLQQIKEVQDKEKINLLAEYSEDFKVEVDTENKEYEKFLIENISDVKHNKDVYDFHYKISAGAEIKSVTQMTVRDTIDKFYLLLKEYGMSNSYQQLSNSKRNAVALKIVGKMPKTYNIEEFLSEIAKAVNEGIKNPQKPESTSGGGGNTGGGGGTSGISSVAVTLEETTSPVKEIFSDVPASHWGYNSIEFLNSKKIINGVGNGKFAPDLSVKREEFVKMVLGALNQKLYDYEPLFSDVFENQWYAPYAVTASKLGIINGVEEGKFGIGESITRQDAAVIIYRCIDKLSDECIPVRGANVFSDDEKISEYAKEAVYHLYKCNVINGITETSFAPLEPLTRAQAAKLLYEIMV